MDNSYAEGCYSIEDRGWALAAPRFYWVYTKPVTDA